MKKFFFWVLILGTAISFLGCTQKTDSEKVKAKGEATQLDLRQKQIVFESNRDGNWEVYVMNPNGSNQHRLTYTKGNIKGKPKGSSFAAWSPDRKKIAFNSNRDDISEIYVMNADGSNIQRLTHTPGQGKRSWMKSWSPDGKKIAFCSNRDGNWEIYVMDSNGSNLQRLTHTTGQGIENFNPVWSPDGKKIAFDSNRDGNVEIYTINPDGTNIQRLTYTSRGKWSFTPHWSPDGQKIVFASTRDGKSEKPTNEDDATEDEIYIMDADGSNIKRLTNNEKSDARPNWSLDGKKIAFQSDRDGDGEIYVMDLDGSNVQQLTVNEHWDGHPDW